jgi:hypothetical protein
MSCRPRCRLLGRWRIVEADLRQDGSLEIAFACQLGDEAILNPVRA